MPIKLKVVGPNQTEVRLNSGTTVFFSYDTPVAACLVEGGFIRTDKKWSVTTSKHINAWLHGANAKKVPQETLDNIQ